VFRISFSLYITSLCRRFDSPSSAFEKKLFPTLLLFFFFSCSCVLRVCFARLRLSTFDVRSSLRLRPAHTDDGRFFFFFTHRPHKSHSTDQFKTRQHTKRQRVRRENTNKINGEVRCRRQSLLPCGVRLRCILLAKEDLATPRPRVFL
jgi:hypothetical protein